MKYFIYLILGLFLFTECKENTGNNANKSQHKTNSPSNNIENTLEKDGYTFELTYISNRDTTSLVSKYKGELRETYELPGKLNKSFYSDINNDKRKEIFITTQNKRGKVVLNGFSLNAGYPIPIKINPIAGTGKANFRSYTKGRNQIIETFQVLAPDKSIVKKVLKYNLVESESGYTLKPEGFTSEQLEIMSGTYVTTDGDKSKNYKTLIIKQNESGEWLVEIEVRKKSTTKSICSFKSVGKFYDKDLYVPLGIENSDLSGTLKISFLESLASIYTQDPNDAKQMATYCNNSASLAGNLKKTTQ